MRNLTTIGLVLACALTYAQTFEELIKQGKDYYNLEKYPESAKKYDDSFKIKSGSSGQYYSASCSWALVGDTIRSIQYLKLAVKNGWRNIEHTKKDPDLIVLHSVNGWEDILQSIQKNIEAYEADLDLPLKEKLSDIYVRDQMLRQLFGDAESKFGSDSQEMKYFWELVSQQDSINEVKVTQIIENNGWVGENIVGKRSNMTLWLVIQHTPLGTQEKYLPLLRESVMKGESNGSHLSLLEDRILMRKGQPQIYGSQITTDQDTGNRTIYEIMEPEYVNQRRKSVGLGPIEDYVSRWGIEWTIEQKVK